LKKGGPPLFPSRLEVMTSEISFQGVGRIELREGEIKDFVVSSRLMRFLVISSSSIFHLGTPGGWNSAFKLAALKRGKAAGHKKGTK